MTPQPYPSDLSDEEWSILAPPLVPGRQAGHPRVFEPRRIADAAFHLLRTGCQWRALPHDFPPWPTVYYHYSRWRRAGTWERINTKLRERHRRATGRDGQPSAAIIDSQSPSAAIIDSQSPSAAIIDSQSPSAAIIDSQSPSAAIIDSQSVRTTEHGGPRAYATGKKVGGRKQQVLVDTQDSLLKATVPGADVQDRGGAELLLEGLATQF